MLTPRFYFAACIYEGKLLVFGGTNWDSTNKVEIYQKTANCWTQHKSMQIDRSALAACVVPGLGLKKQVLDEYQSPTRDQAEMELGADNSGFLDDTSMGQDEDTSSDQISLDDISIEELDADDEDLMNDI